MLIQHNKSTNIVEDVQITKLEVPDFSFNLACKIQDTKYTNMDVPIVAIEQLPHTLKYVK